MYAVEFITEIKNKYIEIPDFENFKDSIVKVILLKTDENTLEEKIKKPPLLDYRKYIRSSNFKVEDGEMTNPFIGIQDTIPYGRELREKSWK